MKKCVSCGALVDDGANFCSVCGGREFSPSEAPAEAPETEPQYDTVGDSSDYQFTPYSYSGASAAVPELEVKPSAGNIVAGVVGAFLFSLGGVLVYFLLYQVGFMAAITGIVTFALANLGYEVFSRSKGSTLGMIVAAVVTLIMIFVSEYLCLSFEIWQAFKDQGINFFDAVRVTPNFLEDSEIRGAIIKDLIFAYIFGIIGLVSAFISARKKK